MIRRGLFLLVCLLGSGLTTIAQAQIPRPPVRPASPPRVRPATTPRVSRPATAPRSDPRANRREIERRRQRRGDRRGNSPTGTTPSASGSAGPAGPGARPAPVGPSRAELKTADKRLRIREALLRGARTEIWQGEAVVPLTGGDKFKSKIKVELRRSRDGSVAQRFTYQRRGDLPDATRLVRRSADGSQGWWLLRPEERRVVTTSAEDALAESALRFQDLVAMDLRTLRAKYVGKRTLRKKVVYVYAVHSLATPQEPSVNIYVRADSNLIERLEFLGADKKVRRQVLFREPRSFGVQKRWTKVIVHDLVGGRSATVTFKKISINPTISDFRFSADKLGA